MPVAKILHDTYSRRREIVDSTPQSIEKELFNKLFEILNCLTRIAETPLITLRAGTIAPFRQPTQSERQYRILRMRYEYFLTESYILQERYGDFLRWLMRQYRKSDNQDLRAGLFIYTSFYRESINNTFEDIRAKRNAHVHKKLHFDESIEQLYFHKAVKIIVGRDKEKYSDMEEYLGFVEKAGKQYYIIFRNLHLKMYRDFSKAQAGVFEHIVSKLISFLYDQKGNFIEP